MLRQLYLIQSGNQQHFVQLIGLLVVAGFSFLSWVIKRLQEQAAKKKALDQLEQRKLEALRTGRSTGEADEEKPDRSAEARAREVAERRRAQIEELRRRQQERSRRQASARGSAPPAPSKVEAGRYRPLPPIVRIPGSSGPIVPQPRPSLPVGARPIPVPKPRPTQERKRPAKPTKRQPDLRPAEPHRIAQSLKEQSASVHPAELGVTQPASPVAMTARPKTPADWRRAIIMNEILSPPKALRGPGEAEGSFPAWPAAGPPGPQSPGAHR